VFFLCSGLFLATRIAWGAGDPGTQLSLSGRASKSVPPVADFVGNPDSGMAPLTVQFTDVSTGDPTSWLWDFGDGAASTAQHPTHVYALGGVYTVSLAVSNAFGSDTETKPDYVATFDMILVTTLVGAVTDWNTGLPIANATVSIIELGLDTATDQAGFYEFEVLPPGAYSVEVCAEGYVDESQIVDAAAGETTTLDFALRSVNGGCGRVAASPMVRGHGKGDILVFVFVAAMLLLSGVRLNAKCPASRFVEPNQ